MFSGEIFKKAKDLKTITGFRQYTRVEQTQTWIKYCRTISVIEIVTKIKDI